MYVWVVVAAVGTMRSEGRKGGAVECVCGKLCCWRCHATASRALHRYLSVLLRLET